jgi:CheY-like chemotaxis protein
MQRNSNTSNQICLLITDDDLDDQLLMQNAIEDNGWFGDHQYFNDGEELLQFLRKKQPTQPTLILLDLNMPRKNGWETLLEIQNDESLKHIPVLIFTTSNIQTDIEKAYKIGSNTYFTKPDLYSDLVEMVKCIKEYWNKKASLAF